MNSESLRMLELYAQGLNCSQVILSAGLSHMNKDNPDLVKAVGGLAGGLGFTGKNCGALTGGACLLSLFAGSDTADLGLDKVDSLILIRDLVDWFEEEVGSQYGGINCTDIVGDFVANQAAPPACANIVRETYAKIEDLLGSQGS